ncbi:aspartate/tyrosine/aromatic aminotransferase [Microlunatus elymi]|uniref:Aminotransferase n=1 Tax=Microlunatus elymi TaxID=2596828 RepID=A0A516PZG2_9ACTN|nr:amino acid aminotransferase [Microlunatus elymi]QDP96554.1 aspartate/tyrosine/aromatic aminotransferase [Microlunatus elymi]
MSVFAETPRAPRDPILGLTEQFVADPRTEKVNLGVGVYQDANGKVPILDCVRTVDAQLAAGGKPYGYLPIDGLPAYDAAVKELVFGAADHDRIAVVQSLGGTGALKVAADFLKQTTPDATVLISAPSWENHRAIFARAGLTVAEYPYYDAEHRRVDVDSMINTLRAAAPGSVVVLHACCHNPTGYDLTADDWQRVVDAVAERGLVPLLDMAYQGFAQSLTEDGAAVRRFVDAGLVTLVTTSFSKTFSLYGERIGALGVVCADADEAGRVLSQLKIIVRTTYSNPPTHGAAIVASVLTDPALRTQWESELAGMRDRIKQMRSALVDGLAAAGVTGQDHITRQNGMFSYSGLSKDQMITLRDDHAVYGLDSGRLCVAAINPGNLDRVISAIAAVAG